MQIVIDESENIEHMDKLKGVVRSEYDLPEHTAEGDLWIVDKRRSSDEVLTMSAEISEDGKATWELVDIKAEEDIDDVYIPLELELKSYGLHVEGVPNRDEKHDCCLWDSKLQKCNGRGWIDGPFGLEDLCPDDDRCDGFD